MEEALRTCWGWVGGWDEAREVDSDKTVELLLVQA